MKQNNSGSKTSRTKNQKTSADKTLTPPKSLKTQAARVPSKDKSALKSGTSTASTKTKSRPKTSASAAKPAKNIAGTTKIKAATHAGFAAIIGAPNAGKSTLLNFMVGQKISIVSPKAQTTRMRILGVLNEGSTQIGLIDTPGIFAPKRRLDRAMVEAAWHSLADADAVIWLVDAAARNDERLDIIIETFKKRHMRVILALNKIDAIEVDRLLPLTARLNESGVVEDTFMISALKGDGVSDLVKHLVSKMPVSPWFFPEDQLSDLPTRLLAAEITREQLYRQLQQELPYAATVIPESWETKRDGSSVIRQTIVVTREAHRPIILGKGGARIKSIGSAARRELERFIESRIHLFLEVKVDEKWQDRSEIYQLFGLDFIKD